MKYRIKQIDDIFYAQYKKFIFWKNYSELQTKEKQSTDCRQYDAFTKFWKNIKFNSIDNAKDFLLLKIEEDSKKKYRVKEYNYFFYPQKKELFIWDYWNIDNYKNQIHFYSFDEASNFLNQVINEKKIIYYQVNYKQNN